MDAFIGNSAEVEPPVEPLAGLYFFNRDAQLSSPQLIVR